MLQDESSVAKFELNFGTAKIELFEVDFLHFVEVDKVVMNKVSASTGI